uniref:Uncharacterized protein n=1 Tax=Ditylenchus dipsaci TaxID=166011 RepID=A0A915EPE9_9BILA
MESWIYMCYYLFNCYCLPWKWWDQALSSSDRSTTLKIFSLLVVLMRRWKSTRIRCSMSFVTWSIRSVLPNQSIIRRRTCDWSGPFHFMAPRNKQASPSGVPKEGRTVTAHPQSPINLPKAGPTISRSPVVETPNELRISAEYTGSKENVQNTDDSQGFASSKTSHKPPEKSCYRLPSNDQGSKNKGQNRRMGEDQEDSSGSSSTDTNTRKGSKSVERENFMSCEAMNAVKDPRHKK